VLHKLFCALLSIDCVYDKCMISVFTCDAASNVYMQFCLTIYSLMIFTVRLPATDWTRLNLQALFTATRRANVFHMLQLSPGRRDVTISGARCVVTGSGRYLTKPYQGRWLEAWVITWTLILQGVCPYKIWDDFRLWLRKPQECIDMSKIWIAMFFTCCSCPQEGEMSRSVERDASSQVVAVTSRNLTRGGGSRPGWSRGH